MNKYQRTPELILDLHGHTVKEAKTAIDALLSEHRYSHIRIITGKCSFREHGPVLAPFVKSYLEGKNISFNYSKVQDGGEGALEVFCK
ncbi:hypothetical protein D4R99_04215 [bacterium]|nr:MAG: hypothetical protein D4R99_04215 [bacterium]